MKNIDVVNLFIEERIFKLEKKQGEYNFNQNSIDELKNIQAIIFKIKGHKNPEVNNIEDFLEVLTTLHDYKMPSNINGDD